MKKIILFVLFVSAFTTLNAQVASKPEAISPLLIGQTLPNEKLINTDNKEVELMSVLKDKQTVLVFYRGGWCPYCNKQLSALGQSEAEILKLGYQIVAVSPEDAQNLKPTIETDKINYQIFSDPKAKLIQKTGIAFKASEKSFTYIKSKTKGEASEILPVPTVMIVNKKGEILFEYINPNYKSRMSNELLMAVLKVLKES